MKNPKSKKRIAILAAVLLSLVLAIGAYMTSTGAIFTDVETSTGNNFSAGTLDLTINGGNVNAKVWDMTNLVPKNQPTGSWTLRNVGSIAGKLSISGISVTETGGVYVDSEGEAGDPNNAGNLGQLVNIRLYVDKDKDGYFGSSDTMLYDGKIANLPAGGINIGQLAPNADTKIMGVVDWWESANDNMGQGDTVTIGLTFLLQQN